MTQYVHYISETEVSYPNPADFRGVPNWQTHDALLRSRGYLPLQNEPEEREGYTAEPSRYELVQQTKSVTRSKQVVVPDYEMDPEHPDVFVLNEHGEKIKSGEHTEYQPFTEEVDDSFVRVVAWTYEPILEPEPEPESDTSRRDAAEEAIVRLIAGLAIKYNAVADVLAMTHPTIESLISLAADKGVPAEELGALITAITPHKWNLEAIQGTLWSECWEGLSSRLPQIVQKVVAEMQ